MIHLINRLYVELDSQLDYTYPFYIISDKDELDNSEFSGRGTPAKCLGVYKDVNMVLGSFMLELIDKSFSNDKVIVYTNKETYLDVIKHLAMAVISKPTLDDIKLLLFFETIKIQHLIPEHYSQIEFDMSMDNVTMDVNVDLIDKLKSSLNLLSFEYRLYNHVIKSDSTSIADIARDIKMFVTRSVMSSIWELRRNVYNSFFNAGNSLVNNSLQHAMVGKINFVHTVPSLKFITNPKLTMDLDNITDDNLNALINDFSVYYKGDPAGCDSVVAVEKDKLLIATGRTSDEQTISEFLRMLRMDSLYHDALDWNDVDLLNLPLLFYIANTNIH